MRKSTQDAKILLSCIVILLIVYCCGLTDLHVTSAQQRETEENNVQKQHTANPLALSHIRELADVYPELLELLDSLQENLEFCEAMFPNDEASHFICVKGVLGKICELLNTCIGDNTTGDTDNDGVCNDLDSDDDGDGWSDSDEIDCGSDPLLSGSYPEDSDGDGVPDCKDGSEAIDDSFGTAGEFIFDSTLGNDLANDVVVSADGSIFITGEMSNGTDSDLFLMKLTRDGLLDTTFFGTGYIIRHNIAAGNSDDKGLSIDFAPDGDLVIGGVSTGPTGYHVGLLWKVSTLGVSDASFGQSGTYLLDVGAEISDRPGFRATYDDFSGNFFALMNHDGKQAYLYRILADGSGLDSSFASTGRLELDPVDSRGISFGMFPDGTLIAAGQQWDFWNSDAISWLMDTKGEIITAYGNPALFHDGLADTNPASSYIGSRHDGWNTVIPYANDRVILAGYGYCSDPSHITNGVVAKVITSNGSFDTSFGAGKGFWTEDVMQAGKTGRVEDAIVRPDGSIVAALEAKTDFSSPNYVVVIRLDADGVRDMKFNTDAGMLVLSDDPSWRNIRLIEHPDGRIIVVASQYNGSDSDIAVWALLCP